MRVCREVWYLILKQNKCHPCEKMGGREGNAASLLSTKVADCELAHSKKKTESIYTCAPLTKLSNEEKAGLQYIGGYVNNQKVSRQSQSLRLSN